MKLHELFEAKEFGEDAAAWINVSGGKTELTDGMPHASAIGTDPHRFGLTDDDIEAFGIPIDKYHKDPDRLVFAVHGWGEDNDGLWGPLYMHMYNNHWIRAYSFEGLEANFSGKIEDLREAWRKRLLQRWIDMKKDKVYLDFIDKEGKRAIEFNLPEERIEMVKWFLGGSTKPSQRSKYH